MQAILRQASRLTILGALAASTVLAQSPPPTPDPSKVTPPSEQTQADPTSTGSAARHRNPKIPKKMSTHRQSKPG